MRDLILMSAPVVLFIYFALHPDQITFIGQFFERVCGE